MMVPSLADIDRVRLMVNTRNLPPWVDRDDIVGAVLLRLVSDRFDSDKGTYRAFVDSRMFGSIADELRKQGHRGFSLKRQGPNCVPLRFGRHAPDVITESPDYEFEIRASYRPQYEISASRRCAISRAIALLRPRLRRVVVLYYWHGLLQREIGVRFGVSESMALKILHQALRELRNIMLDQGVESLSDVMGKL